MELECVDVHTVMTGSFEIHSANVCSVIESAGLVCDTCCGQVRVEVVSISDRVRQGQEAKTFACVETLSRMMVVEIALSLA